MARRYAVVLVLLATVCPARTVQDVWNATVIVESGGGYGTGTAIVTKRKSMVVLTAAHVVPKETAANVGGLVATEIGRRDDDDLLLLEVPGLTLPATELTLGEPAVGDAGYCVWLDDRQRRYSSAVVCQTDLTIEVGPGDVRQHQVAYESEIAGGASGTLVWRKSDGRCVGMINCYRWGPASKACGTPPALIERFLRAVGVWPTAVK